MSRWLLLCTLVLLACDRSRQVAVHVTTPDTDSVETPVQDLVIVALPYDRDSAIASIIAAGSPRPEAVTAALDSLYAVFRVPFTAFAAAAIDVRRLRDSLTALEGRLDTPPPGPPERRALAVQVSRVSDSVASAERRLEAARAELARIRAEVAGPTDSLRAVYGQWEDSTFEMYDSTTAALARGRWAEPRADTTNTMGWAAFTLPEGDWWLVASSWDVSDPNAEWYWNVPVQGDTVRLSSRNGRRRPRY